MNLKRPTAHLRFLLLGSSLAAFAAEIPVRTSPGADGIARRLEASRRGPVSLELGGRALDLEIEPVDLRAPGYSVSYLTSRGVDAAPPSAMESYRGRIRGKPASAVSLTWRDGRLSGFAEDGEAADRKGSGSASGGPRCGHADAQGGAERAAARPMPTGPQASAPGEEPCRRLKLAIGVDHSFVKALGSPAAVEARLHEVYAQVDALYRDPRLNIQITISEIIMETEPGTAFGDADGGYPRMDAFHEWFRSGGKFKNPYDAAVLWFHMDDLNGVTGVGYVGVICGQINLHVVGMIGDHTLGAVRTAAHELGHNFGGNHVFDTLSVMAHGPNEQGGRWDDATVAAIQAHKRGADCLSACHADASAGFTTAGASSCSETRRFVDRSQGAPVSWKWDFGDGASSTEKEPTHTYAATGYYLPRLTIANAEGRTSVFGNGLWVKRGLEAPAAKGAGACAPASVTLEAQGKGLLRWYDTADGGAALAEGPAFRTPVLSRSKTYYVEDAEAGTPIAKLGPGFDIFPFGEYYKGLVPHGLVFDVRRPARLVSVKVKAGSAGPRVFEVADAKGRVVAGRKVELAAGENRVPLGIDLEAGRGYTLKHTGSGDAVNLFRLLNGAKYPYATPDSLIVITGNTGTQFNGYLYFFEWEVQGRGCAGPRTPVLADLSCPNGLDADPAAAWSARAARSGPGRFRLVGAARDAADLEIEIRGLDGKSVGRWTRRVAAGGFREEFVAKADGPGPWLASIRLGAWRRRQVILE